MKIEEHAGPLCASITVFAKTLELESKLRMTLGISNSKKLHDLQNLIKHSLQIYNFVTIVL